MLRYCFPRRQSTAICVILALLYLTMTFLLIHFYERLESNSVSTMSFNIRPKTSGVESVKNLSSPDSQQQQPTVPLEDKVQGIPTGESHIPYEVFYDSSKRFMSIGAYLLDGSLPEDETLDEIKTPIYTSDNHQYQLVVLGAGDFHPHDLACVVNFPGKSSFRTKAHVHVQGTVYEEALSDSGKPLYTGEKGVWISCILDGDSPLVADVKLHQEVNVNHGDILGTVDIVGDNFSISSVTVRNFISQKIQRHKLVQCSAPIHSIKGTQWLIEWIEYHRAFGFDHLHLYIYDTSQSNRKLLDYYASTGYITIHDWSKINSGGVRGVKMANWEHGQRLARNDCFLRNRGVSKYAAMCDADELFALNWDEEEYLTEVSWVQMSHNFKKGLDRTDGEPISAKRLIAWMDLINSRNSETIGFLFSSVTVPPFHLNDYPNDWDSDNLPHAHVSDILSDEKRKELFLSSFAIAERSCQEPYNCGLYHRGRQKYIVRTSYGAVNPNTPMFYHAISENYKQISDKLMVQVPRQIGYLRHYAGHFKHSRVGGLPPGRRRTLPLAGFLLKTIASNIQTDSILLKSYFEPEAEKQEQFLKLQDSHNMFRFQKPTDASVTDSSEVDAKSSPVGYITFERFRGRLNNQLITYDWAFRLSLSFNRRLFISNTEERELWIGLPRSKKEEHELGAVWDLRSLRKRFDFVMEYDEAFAADKDILTKPFEELDPKCVWTYEYGNENNNILPAFMESRNELKECRNRIHLRTFMGLVHPKRTDTRKFGVGPLVFWSALKPSPYLLEPVHRFIDGVRQNNPGKEIVGVHSRSINSYHEAQTKAINRCTRLAMKVITSAVLNQKAQKSCCGERKGLVQSDLEGAYNRLKLYNPCNFTGEYIKTHQLGSSTKQIVYASDHQNEQVDALFKSYGAVSIKEMGHSSFHSRKDKHKRWRENIEMVLTDMLSLVETDHFHGSPASTLSHVICFWRLSRARFEGTDEKSNLCSLVLLSTGTFECNTLSCGSGSMKEFHQLAY